MFGWNGKYLLVNLTTKKITEVSLDKEILLNYLGGRGLAVRLLWDLVKPGTDPLSPDNVLIFAVGPLTGYPLPSSGKMVIAAKSPLTHGYGDGNIGTRAAVELRKAGYDAIVVTGASDKPVKLVVECGKASIEPAEDLWGMRVHDLEPKLYSEYGKNVGALYIGPAGENLVKFATVISEFGRSGGRPGLGTVMGSKKLKAVVIKGCKELPKPADQAELVKLGAEAYRVVKEAEGYDFWIRQGTMMTVEWSNKNSVLPTYNFREGVYDFASGIDGYTMEKMKVAQKGCPNCNMPCGNIVEYQVDNTKARSELDYENVAMLGSNIGIGDLNKVSHLNKLADDLGLDTISLGSSTAFAMEATEKGLIKDGIEWGDFNAAVQLTEDIAHRRGELGNLMADGTRAAAEKLGNGAMTFAMQVKGLEISAYDCHAAPGMALAYGTSSIGAHHKDAWFISLEIKMGRDKYTDEKVEKLVWMQNIRGAVFESLVTCRLPWVELGLNLDYYPKFLKAATGVSFTWDDLHKLAERVYTLIRAFWVREYAAEGRGWGRHMDYPPERWFTEPLTKGPLAGAKLDKDGYDRMLSKYYELRGWDERGVPRKSTLERLGLGFVYEGLKNLVELKD